MVELGEGIKLVHAAGELNSLQEARWVGEFGARLDDVKNEVPLCRFSHHPLVTEGGYSLRAGPGRLFELVRPGGP